MSFDGAWTRYAEFGRFWVGMVDDPDQVLESLGVR